MITIKEAARRFGVPEAKLYHEARSARILKRIHRIGGNKHPRILLDEDEVANAKSAGRLDVKKYVRHTKAESAAPREKHESKRGRGKNILATLGEADMQGLLLDIGRTYNTTREAADIAKKYGVSVFAIYTLAKELRKRGVKIPKRSKRNRQGLIDQAVAVLLAEEVEETGPRMSAIG